MEIETNKKWRNEMKAKKEEKHKKEEKRELFRPFGKRQPWDIWRS
jgi:hypothetical protein